MSIARQRSIRKIAAFRERHLVEHTNATWFDASLAYVMQADRQRIGDVAERTERDKHEQADYASFVNAARSFAQASVEPPKLTREGVVTEVRLWLAYAVTGRLNAN
jgi:hypothetical protein